MKLKAILMLAVAALALASCEVSSPEDIARSRIKDIIYDLTSAFNWKQIGSIMQYVHPDYLHNGLQDHELRELWLDRMALYDLLTCSVLEIAVDGDYAVVSMELTFQSAEHGTQVLNEPHSSGDVSYFYNDGSGWRIYGNQLWER